MSITDKGITAPKGFKALGAHIGIKKDNKDFAIIHSETSCTAAGVFTQNLACAAPVVWDKKIIESGGAGDKFHAIVTVSGNANAATRKQGLKDAEEMAVITAEKLGVETDSVFVCSTGIIGVNLPMDTVRSGIGQNAANTDDTRASARACAEAIGTTDTFIKEFSLEAEIGGKTVSFGGIAKGSGMIHPNMATTLGFVTTDCAITSEMLQLALKRSIDISFNMISVDGDTSTNDTVLVLANGLTQNEIISSENEDFEKFSKALTEICQSLAKSVAKDGEGASRFIEVALKGACDETSARLIARSVVSSSLTKAAMFSPDANWGRILCAMGYSGGKFDPEKACIAVASSKGAEDVFVDGAPVPFDEDKAFEILSEKEVVINIDLKDGDFTATAWGCDLTYDYVKINGSYRS